MAIIFAIAACSAPADSPSSTTTLESPAGPGGQPTQAGFGLEELRKRGRLALREQRIYAPAGDNAMEYYIALRDASKGGDQQAVNALMELQPYAVIATEQALGRKDFIEAERLHRLLAASDPQAPSLKRIAAAIARGLLGDTKGLEDKPASSDVDTVVASAPANGSIEFAVPTPASIPSRASSPTVIASVPAPPRDTVVAPAVSRPPPASLSSRQPTAVPADAPRRTELVAVRTPQPEYPAEKRQKGAVGRVLASFTVNSDGTVGDVRTESIGSRHISFERSVARAVKRWKYQPPGESRIVTKSFSFAP